MPALFSKSTVVEAAKRAEQTKKAHERACAKFAECDAELVSADRVVLGEDSERAALRQVAAKRAKETARLEVDQARQSMQDADRFLTEAQAEATAADHADGTLLRTAKDAYAQALRDAQARRTELAVLLDVLTSHEVRRHLTADPTEGFRPELKAMLGDSLPAQVRRLFDEGSPLPLGSVGLQEGARRMVIDRDAPHGGRHETLRGGAWVADPSTVTQQGRRAH